MISVASSISGGRTVPALRTQSSLPDLAEYQAGREQGLREFCKPANGFRVGARGASYGGVCPTELDESFVDAWQSGRQLYVLRSRVGSEGCG